MLNSFVKWQERYASFGLNRKLAGILPPGVYWGFELAPGVGLRIKVAAEVDDYPASVAVVEREGYSITLRMEDTVELECPGAGIWYPVLEAYYTPGQDTWQQLKLVTDPAEHHVVLGTITVPPGTTDITPDMISEDGRMVGNQAMMILQFTSALVDNETELLGYKQRLANLERWAKTQSYDPDTLYL